MTAVEWLADQLALIARPYSAHVALYYAYQIRGAWMAYYWRFDIYAIEVRGTGQQLYTRRVPANRGPLVELRRLAVATRGRSVEKFTSRWFNTSGRTLRLVISGWAAIPPPIIRREFDAAGRLVNFERADFVAAHRCVAIDGHVRVMPPQHEAVALVEAALRRWQALPVSERRMRVVDELADDLAREVAHAFFKMTGGSGLTWSDRDRQATGPLLELANNIEVQFDIEARFAGHGRRRHGAFTFARLRKFSGGRFEH